MPIDIQTQQIVTLRQACDLLPRRRRGKKVAVETLYRWSLSGCRGVKLETIQIGGTRCTSREALQRFFDALTTAAGTSDAPAAPKKLTRQRRAEMEAAEKACREAGI